MSTTLSREDAALLGIVDRFYRQAGARERAFREELGLTATQAAIRLNRLADDPAAIAYAPQVTSRLRRQREQREARVWGAGR